MRAVVLSFDRLHSGFLGFCGNPTIKTPHWDRLAADSAIFDRHYLENFDPHARNHAWWTGCYQLPASYRAQELAYPSVIERLAQDGVRARLVLPASVELPGAERHFDQIATFPESESWPAVSLLQALADWGEAVTSELEAFAAAPAQPELLWLHGHGVDWNRLARDWGNEISHQISTDTAASDQKRAVSTFDFRGREGTAAGSLSWSAIACDYAAAMQALDEQIGRLTPIFERILAAGDCLLIITAAAGEDWNASPAAGDAPALPSEELVHVPLLLKGNEAFPAGRFSPLVQSVDIGPTLLDWFETPCAPAKCDGGSLLPLLRGEQAALREAAFFGCGTSAGGMRSEEFLYRVRTAPGADREDPAGQLFSKPQDYWDIDDVSRQYSDVVAQMDQSLRDFAAQLRSKHAAALSQTSS